MTPSSIQVNHIADDEGLKHSADADVVQKSAENSVKNAHSPAVLCR